MNHAASMRLSQTLTGLGSPIAYHAGLAKLLGGVKATVLFGQLFYWSQRTDRESGEFWKSQQELSDETGLTTEELRAARKELEQRRVVRSRYARIEHRLYFSIDRDQLDTLWLRHNGHLLESEVPPWDLPDGDAVEADFGSDRSEITSEITNTEGERDKSRTPSPIPNNGHRKPKTPWPENFELTLEMARYAEDRGIDAQVEFRSLRRRAFRDGERHADWMKRWEEWVERAVEHKKAGSATTRDLNPHATGAGERMKRWQEAIERQRSAKTPEERDAARREIERLEEGERQPKAAKRREARPDGVRA